MERITSRKNPLIAHFRKLAVSASYRRECGTFLCDGYKLAEEAVRWGVVRTALVAEDPIQPLFMAKRQIEVPPAVMEAVSPSRTPQGIVCECEIPDRPLPDPLPGRRYVVLDGVQDPGNVGTILRTADAFGADGVFLLDGCADPYSPKTVRSGMGVVFRLPVWQVSAEALASLLDRSGLPLYGAALDENARDIRDMDWNRFAAAIGSEGRGLSQEVLDLCRGTFRIPMRQRCESLNAAMAAGVVLWEAAREEDLACRD